MSLEIPGYIYSNEDPDLCLLQGDVIKIDGTFRELFSRFYEKAVQIEGRDDRYAMVVTQSCDLVRRKSGGKPGCTHISVCLVSPLDRFIKYEVEKLGLPTVEGRAVIDAERFVAVQTKIARLINNSESKHHFFLPARNGLPGGMVAQLHLPYSFRSEHYEAILNSRVASLLPEFSAKVGYVLADFYGRVATSDLYDPKYGFDERKLSQVAREILEPLLLQVPNQAILDQVKAGRLQSETDVDGLIEASIKARAQKFMRDAEKLFAEALVAMSAEASEIAGLADMEQKAQAKASRAIAKKHRHFLEVLAEDICAKTMF